MERLRRVAVWVVVLYWACCLAAHVVVAVTRPGPLPGYTYAYWFLLTMAVAIGAGYIFKSSGPVAKDTAPCWYVPVLGIAALICGLWPIVVGSGYRTLLVCASCSRIRAFQPGRRATAN